jgi:HNH endonuclease
MPWAKTPADRARDARVYQDPEYKRNKALVRRRSGGRCEVPQDGRQCGSRDRVQCDHVIPVSQGGTHALENLRDTCHAHHAAKTAGEGGGWRQRPDPPPSKRTEWLPAHPPRQDVEPAPQHQVPHQEPGAAPRDVGVEQVRAQPVRGYGPRCG